MASYSSIMCSKVWKFIYLFYYPHFSLYVQDDCRFSFCDVSLICNTKIYLISNNNSVYTSRFLVKASHREASGNKLKLKLRLRASECSLATLCCWIIFSSSLCVFSGLPSDSDVTGLKNGHVLHLYLTAE